MNKILIGADHGGYELKKFLIEKLKEQKYEVEDVGFETYDPTDDFPDIAFKLGEKVVVEKVTGILICKSGIGVSVSVNKVKGVRGGLCTSVEQAEMAKRDTNINVLCLSSMLNSNEKNLEIVNKFINTQLASDERFTRRINKITNYES